VAPLVVLVVAFLAARVAARLGVARLQPPKAAGRAATAAMFGFTGSTHFSPMKHDYLAMLPPPLPKRLALIHLTGALEIAGAVGLLLDRTRRLAGAALLALLAALFPANVYAAREGIPLRGRPPTPLRFRAPLQVVFGLAVWWSAVRRP
jgi:uncharacterized membrane protein